MAYDNHAFCWNGIVTTDAAAAKKFYGETIGWDSTDHEFPGGAIATMFVAGGVPRAHLRPPEGGESSRWSSYLRVDDVDASTAAAAANGGAVLQQSTDIEPGRFSVIATPSGVVFCLYHEADEATAENAPAGEGAIHWVEVPDVDAALARATALGGQAPEDGQDWPGVGRMAMVTDPTGAVFGVITPV